MISRVAPACLKTKDLGKLLMMMHFDIIFGFAGFGSLGLMTSVLVSPISHIYNLAHEYIYNIYIYSDICASVICFAVVW